MLTFGDSVLDPETGDLVAHPMTPRRASALIRELRHVCIGFEVGWAATPIVHTSLVHLALQSVARPPFPRFRCWTLILVLNQTTN